MFQQGDPSPSVTVVMAAYDAGAFIDAALASIAGQAVRPAQVIVVDDASTDDTAERARRWTDLLPVTVLQLERNVGAGAARAEAMRAVTTDLACFLDADDVFLPHHLEQLIGRWRRRGGVVSPRALVWTSGRPPVDYHRSLGLRVPRRQQLARLLAANYVFYGALFETEAYVEVGGMRALRLAEDWDLWVRLSAAGKRISTAPTASMLYRRHTANVTGPGSAVDAVRTASTARLREQHPDWLSPRRWDTVLQHDRALATGRRGLKRLRACDVRGLRDVANARAGGTGTISQLSRQVAYFGVQAARGRPTPQF